MSLEALEVASKGEYQADKVRETVDDHYICRYFNKKDDKLFIKEEVKKLIVFDFHNLIHKNELSDLDIIFCRNVMIYFDTNNQKKLISKFHQSLNPGGYLFLGHSESLQGMETGFKFKYGNKSTAYKKPVRS